MSASLPVLGAALNINSIPKHRDWLLERQRDLEIQDFIWTEQLDGDWRTNADRINSMLDGHTGRRGIHGPFWGFKIDSQDPMIRGMVTKRVAYGDPFAVYDVGSQQSRHGPERARQHDRARPRDSARGHRTRRKHRLRGRDREHRGQEPA
jgi:hypothetical protein